MIRFVKTQRKLRRPMPRAIALEVLERRRLLAADVMLLAGTEQSDNLSIRFDQVRDVVEFTANRELIGTYPVHDGLAIYLDAGGGDDFIFVDPLLPIPVNVRGGDGIDSLSGILGDQDQDVFVGAGERFTAGNRSCIDVECIVGEGESPGSASNDDSDFTPLQLSVMAPSHSVELDGPAGIRATDAASSIPSMQFEHHGYITSSSAPEDSIITRSDSAAHGPHPRSATAGMAMSLGASYVSPTMNYGRVSGAAVNLDGGSGDHHAAGEARLSSNHAAGEAAADELADSAKEHAADQAIQSWHDEALVDDAIATGWTEVEFEEVTPDFPGGDSLDLVSSLAPVSTNEACSHANPRVATAASAAVPAFALPMLPITSSAVQSNVRDSNWIAVGAAAAAVAAAAGAVAIDRRVQRGGPRLAIGRVATEKLGRPAGIARIVRRTYSLLRDLLIRDSHRTCPSSTAS